MDSLDRPWIASWIALLLLFLQVGLANVLGRANRMTFGHTLGSHGTRRTEGELKVPIAGYFRSDTNKTADFVAHAFYGRQTHAWSALKASDSGISLGADLSPFSWLQQVVVCGSLRTSSSKKTRFLAKFDTYRAIQRVCNFNSKKVQATTVIVETIIVESLFSGFKRLWF